MNIINILQMIVLISSAIGALVGLYKFARNFEKRFDKIDAHFDNIDCNLNNNTLMTLKLVIMNEKLSLEERISAGDLYISQGGNGYVKKVYEHLLLEAEKDLNKE